MNMTPVRIVQQTTQTSSAGAQPKLQAGSVVQARVLAQTGAGQYVISVAGQKIAVRSEMPLAQGAVFSAKISVRGEQVLFSLVGAQGETKPLVSQFTAGALQNGMDAGLSQLLASLGLPASAESFGLLQFAQAMGIKIDPRQLRKALATAKQAGGVEEAAQTALVLDEKGLNASADAVKAVATGFGGRERGERGQDGAHSDELGGGDQQRDDGERRRDEDDRERGEIAEDDDATLTWQDETQAAETPPPPADERAALSTAQLSARFVAADDAVAPTLMQDYVASVDEAAVRNEVGALTLFNTFRGAEKTDADAHRWVMLPFSWTDGFSGVIRILPAADKKKLRQIAINAKNPHKNYNIVLYYKQGRIASARFSVEPPLSDAQGKTFAAAFSALLAPLGGVPSVEYVADLHGFCMADEPIAVVQGAV